MTQNGATNSDHGDDETDVQSRLTRLRMELLRSLPTDIRRARKAYHRVASEAAGVMDARGFVNHQAACKAALAHVESLIKLLRWVCEEDMAGVQPVGKGGSIDRNGKPGAGADENGVDQPDVVSHLIAAARQAMQGR
jgi:hypothetical protein